MNGNVRTIFTIEYTHMLVKNLGYKTCEIDSLHKTRRRRIGSFSRNMFFRLISFDKVSEGDFRKDHFSIFNY